MSNTVKLIIEIPKETYLEIRDGLSVRNAIASAEAIKNGIPLSEDGEYIKKKDALGCFTWQNTKEDAWFAIRDLPAFSFPDSAENKGDLISKEKVKDIVRSGISTDTEADKEYVYGLIDSIPSADVRPNIHGHWMKDDALSITIDIYKCSICSSISGARHYNFCPKCGADMREPKGEKRD